MQQNPGHTWATRSPKFPNREEGIYPTGPGNEWRNDPTAAQSPVDLHLAAHTAEYGLGTAAAIGAPVAAVAAAPSALAYGSTALANPAVQQGLKMLGSKILSRAVDVGTLGAGYKILKGLGIIHGFGGGE
jgi:hypothetical protein